MWQIVIFIPAFCAAKANNPSTISSSAPHQLLLRASFTLPTSVGRFVTAEIRNRKKIEEAFQRMRDLIQDLKKGDSPIKISLPFRLLRPLWGCLSPFGLLSPLPFMVHTISSTSAAQTTMILENETQCLSSLSMTTTHGTSKH